MKKGALYIVATPIGNLNDISFRAVDILKQVDCIAAEDTRHSIRLLKHLNFEKPLIPLHEHNEREESVKLLKRIEAGESIAIISDAGTPLISDPGYHIVRLAHQNNIPVIPIPGPAALITALSASGLPTDRFSFEGFLPAKEVAKQKALELLAKEERTLIFYEAPHRVLETLQTMALVFGMDREATVARELTKTFESIKWGKLSEILEWINAHSDNQRGEFVIMVAGFKKQSEAMLSPETEKLLKILLSELSVKQAAGLAAKITGISRSVLYEYCINLNK